MQQEYKLVQEDKIKKARRTLKNYMVRMYEYNLNRGWKAYLKVYSAHKLRNYIIKKVLMH